MLSAPINGYIGRFKFGPDGGGERFDFVLSDIKKVVCRLAPGIATRKNRAQ